MTPVIFKIHSPKDRGHVAWKSIRSHALEKTGCPAICRLLRRAIFVLILGDVARHRPGVETLQECKWWICVKHFSLLVAPPLAQSANSDRTRNGQTCSGIGMAASLQWA